MSKTSTLKPEWIHISEFASVSADGKITIVGIFDELRSPNIPAVQPQFFISGVFKGTPKSSHSLLLKINPPSGKDSISVGAPQTIELGKNGRLNVVLGIGSLPLKEWGTYKFEILEDKKVIASKGIQLIKVDDGGSINGGK